MTGCSAPPDAHPGSPSTRPVGHTNGTLDTDQDKKREQAHDVFGVGAQFLDDPCVTFCLLSSDILADSGSYDPGMSPTLRARSVTLMSACDFVFRLESCRRGLLGVTEISDLYV
jgi:hypothetical protein